MATCKGIIFGEISRRYTVGEMLFLELFPNYIFSARASLALLILAAHNPTVKFVDAPLPGTRDSQGALVIQSLDPPREVFYSLAESASRHFALIYCFDWPLSILSVTQHNANRDSGIQ